MSYHLHIKKLSNNQLQERAIPIEEWLGILKNDDDFSCIVDEGNSVSAIFSKKPNHSESIAWHEGDIDAMKPSDMLAKKMILLANVLNGRVVTDKGLCYF